MGKQAVILSALLCSGTLALSASTLWSQTSGTQSERGNRMSQSDPTSTSGTSAAMGRLSSTEITQVQQALKAKGHDPGPVDGVMSSKTHQAIRAFQQANGLQATGTMDPQTAAALGVSTGGSGTSAGPAGRSESGRSPSGGGSGLDSSESSSGSTERSSPGSGTSPSDSRGGASGGTDAGSSGSGS